MTLSVNTPALPGFFCLKKQLYVDKNTTNSTFSVDTSTSSSIIKSSKHNGATGLSSATPALRGNEVNMDTIDLGNNESLVCGVFPNQDGTFTAMTYTKSKTFKTESGARRWLARNTD